MKRRATVSALAGVSVVAIAGIGAFVWLTSRPPSAEEAANRYLSALTTGDVAALSQLGAFSSPESETGARARAAFEAAAAHVEGPEIIELAQEGDSAAVRALGDFRGESRAIVFGLELREGAWRLESDHYAAVETTTTLGDSVWVGGALVPAGDVALLPAVYNVSPAPSAVLSGGGEIVVSNDAPILFAVDAALSPDAQAVAQNQLDGYLRACTAPSARVPEACGIVVPWGVDFVDVTGLRYRIDSAPALTLDAAAGTFAATGGDLIVTATGSPRGAGPESVTYRDSRWGVRGTLLFSGNEMLLQVW